jgi:FkbM family methyltransferase
MEVLVRRFVWHNPYSMARMPILALVYRAAFAEASRLCWRLLQYPLFKVFPLLYRLGLGGRAALRIQTSGLDKVLPFDPRNLQFASLYMPQYKRGYEPETLALLDALVGSANVFYDVGSNWGYYALFLAFRKGFSGRVHAFEPEPGSFRDLRALVDGAGLKARVSCHQLALSDRGGEGHLLLPDRLHSGLASVSSEASGTSIELRPLDALGLEPPDVMKLDVEGHEAAVLRGARRTMATARPHVILESWLRWKDPSATLEPLHLLQECGYRLFQLAWLEGLPGGGDLVSDRIDLVEGVYANLALVPLKSPQRFLLKEQLNILACHAERLPELRVLFTPRNLNFLSRG